MVRVISQSELKKNMNTEMERVCNDFEPLIVYRKNRENVVILSESDYSSLKETLYLMQSPANYQRILEAIARGNSSKNSAKTD